MSESVFEYSIAFNVIENGSATERNAENKKILQKKTSKGKKSFL